MSGRKASEVSGLLQQGKKARCINEENWYQKTGAYLEKVRLNQEEINKTYDDIRKNPISLDENLKKDEDLVFILARLKDLSTKIERDTYTVKINRLNERWKSLMKELNRIDDEAEGIRKIIASKPHYCDNEYNQAAKLVGEYQRITRTLLQIIEETNCLEEASSSDFYYASQVNEYRIQLQEYQKVSKDLGQAKEPEEDKTAGNVNLLANYFIDKVNEIGLSPILEFAASEYEQLKHKIDGMIAVGTVTDQELDLMKEEMSNLFLTIKVGQDEWKREKEKTERSYLRVKRQAEEDNYYDPLDYAENDKYAKKIHLFEFLAQFHDTEHEVCFNASVEAAEEFLRIGELSEAANHIAAANESLRKANEIAAVLQENMVKNIFLAKDMQEAMESLSYEVEITCIDGNMKNGVKVTCRSGDEEIDFDKVLVEEEGNVIIDINHTESKKNTCGATWKEIAAVMREYNIPMTDVRKNGQSLLYSTKEKVRLDRMENRLWTN